MKASHLAVSSLVRGSLVCFAIVLLVAPAARPFEQPHVTVTPGTPNVWSMEQAHYLLNRLRANRDGIQLAKPSEGDLNPNATHGIRLDAIQTFLGIAASFNQIAGTQNRLALEEYNANTGRTRELLDLADAKRRQAQAAQLESIRLQQEEALLKTQIAAATDPQAKAALEAKAAALLAQRQALDSTVTVLAAQVTDLTTAAGHGAPAAGTGAASATGTASTATATGAAASSVPSLTATDAEINKQIQSGLLGSAFTALLNKSVAAFSEPKLHASQVLDNFVQMQYEVVAKQLTTLRDEAGKGQRVVFLELPTSVAAGNERKFVSGGQNRLAQSWWQIKTVYLGYSRDSSPCWIGGSDVYDGMQSLLFLEGHGESVDQVPTMQKIKPGKPGDASDELARAVAQWLNVELNQLDKEPAAQDSEKDRIQTRVKNIRRWPTTARDWAKSAIEDLGDLTDRLRQAREKAFEAETKYLAGVAKGRQAKAERQALLDAMTTLARTESLRVERGKTASAAWQSLDRLLGATPSPSGTPEMDETTARTAWEQSLSVVANLKAESHRIEAAILGLGLSPSGRELPLMYPDASTQATVNRLEQPCRTAQLEFTEAERYAQEDRKRALLAQERTEAAARELGSVGKEILTLESEKDDFTADKAEADRDAVASGERIKTLEASIKTAEGQTPRPIKRLAGLKSRLTQEKQKADEATQRSQKFGRLLGAVSKNLQELNTSVTRLKSEIAKGNSLREEIARLERLSALRSDILRDRLERYQTEVYAEFGGPASIHQAFKMEITPPCEFEQGCSERNQDTGLIRAIEIFPRQTALNVNKTHLTTNRTVVSAVGKSLGGFGGKLDYDRMREKYDQFVQQEVFASGFGKGRTSFGWTFGPTPGTSVLNPGTRTTYAALAVPANATAIEVESAGCSFHHNRTGPQAYPPLEGRVSRRDMEGVDCSHQSRFQLGLPDGHTAGGFEIREVRYTQVKPGERATIVLNGRFSPETTVLVNGKRLNQLAGLGKPQLPMDSGGLEDPGSGVISGSFEFVNTQYLAISLSIPADYKDARFPQLTLISPARTAILNKIPVSVNGAPGQSLEAANLLKETKQPFEIKGFEFLGEDRATGLVTARLTGTRLGQIGNLWVDGRLRPDAVTPISDSDVLVRFAPSGRYRWEIVAATGESDPSRRASSTFSAPNPLKLMIAGTAVKTGSVSYDKDSKPVSAEVVIAGAGFRPELKLGVSGAAIAKSAYVSPTEWYCRIEKIQPERANDGVIFTLTPDKPEKPVASSAVSFPEKEHEKDKDPKANVKTTLTQIEKKVTTDK